MPVANHAREDEVAVAEIWRKALWILEALPPRRAPDAGGVLRTRKLAAYLSAVVGSRGEARKSLERNIAGDISFLVSLMWWASDRGVAHDGLHDFNIAQGLAGKTLVGETGSRPAAHAWLVSFARKHTKQRDEAFSKASILAHIVAELQSSGTALGTDCGLRGEGD